MIMQNYTKHTASQVQLTICIISHLYDTQKRDITKNRK